MLGTRKSLCYVAHIACALLTMCDGFPATCHDAITQLDDLGNADYLLRVVALIRQQNQEEKDVWNDGFRVPVKKVKINYFSSCD